MVVDRRVPSGANARTHAGQGPVGGTPIREALYDMLEADRAEKLEPPLSEPIRELFEQMDASVGGYIEAWMDGYTGKAPDEAKARYLETLDEEWFSIKGHDRPAAMMMLQLAVDHGMKTT